MNNNKIKKIEPLFNFNASKQSVLLASDSVTIKVGSKTYTGNGEVRIDLLPRANIHVYSTLQGISLKISLKCLSGLQEITSFSFGKIDIPGFYVGSGGDLTKQNMTLKWCPQNEPIIGIGDDSTEIRRLIFHLFNFKDFLGTRRSLEQCGSNTHSIHNVDLANDDWKVELRSLVSTEGSFKKLITDGGYALTHVGCLQRKGNSAFQGKQGEITGRP